MKVAHITSVHPRHDIRIFQKECLTLKSNGYEVCLLVADGMGNQISLGVNIIDVGKSLNRFYRMIFATTKLFVRALIERAHVYHIHDPELLILAWGLKFLGRTVIFDSHEDVGVQLLSKPYLDRRVSYIASKFYVVFELMTAKILDGVVCATEVIAQKFEKANKNVVVICNYPDVTEFPLTKSNKRDPGITSYVGALTSERGIREIIQAMSLVETDTCLNLAGEWASEQFMREARLLEGWKKTKYLGYLDRSGVSDLLSRSSIGLVTLHPLENYIEAKPIKLFEYMAAGVPVIASDFPAWREIVEQNECGFCVNPLDAGEIAQAMNILLQDEKLSERFGSNGMKLVQEKFNWGAEREKLLSLYAKFEAY